MNTTLKRIAIHGGLVVVGLLIFGMMFGQIAGMWVASQTPPRPTAESLEASQATTQEMTTQIKWRVPITMAAMGFGLVVVFELLGSIWRTKKPIEPLKTTPTISEEELMIQKLLKEAEQNPANTPSPIGVLKNELSVPANG